MSNMLKIKYKIKSDDMNSSKFNEINSYLDHIFELDTFTNNEKELLDFKFSNIIKNCSKNLDEIMIFIRNNSVNSPIESTGKFCLYYLWPFFFEKFSKGEIWILEYSNSWMDQILDGEYEVYNYYSNLSNSEIIIPSHSFSGLFLEEFLFNCLNFLSNCIYPFISSVNISVKNLIFIYFPEKCLSYKWKTLGKLPYSLMNLHQLFDDDLTFDSSRGPKSEAAEIMGFVNNYFDFYVFFIDKINNRMDDILNITDVFKRQKAIMTINRLLYEAQLIISIESPYFSKTLFFNFLDKLSNIFVFFKLLDFEEVMIWKHFFKEEFYDDIYVVLETFPDPIKSYFKEIIEMFLNELNYCNLNPDLMRTIRNTHHGYHLKGNQYDNLMKHDGNINNDIPLIASVLIIYLISKEWTVN